MISGYTCVISGVKHDYCFRECILSMLRVSSEVVVGYSDPTDGVDDGTRDVLASIERECGSSVRVLDHTEWMKTNPIGVGAWFTNWINHIRPNLKGQTQLWLDADEVLADDAVVPELKPTWYRRLNFWRDVHHLCPEGHVCSPLVVRSGAVHYWMPTDNPYITIEQARLIEHAGKPNPVHDIFHYGFIRKPEAFLAKARWFQPVLIGCHDERLKHAETDTSKHWADFYPFDKPLVPIKRKHPAVALQWLADRGHTP